MNPLLFLPFLLVAACSFFTLVTCSAAGGDFGWNADCDSALKQPRSSPFDPADTIAICIKMVCVALEKIKKANDDADIYLSKSQSLLQLNNLLIAVWDTAKDHGTTFLLPEKFYQISSNLQGYAALEAINFIADLVQQPIISRISAQLEPEAPSDDQMPALPDQFATYYETLSNLSQISTIGFGRTRQQGDVAAEQFALRNADEKILLKDYVDTVIIPCLRTVHQIIHEQEALKPLHRFLLQIVMMVFKFVGMPERCLQNLTLIDDGYLLLPTSMINAQLHYAALKYSKQPTTANGVLLSRILTAFSVKVDEFRMIDYTNSFVPHIPEIHYLAHGKRVLSRVHDILQSNSHGQIAANVLRQASTVDDLIVKHIYFTVNSVLDAANPVVRNIHMYGELPPLMDYEPISVYFLRVANDISDTFVLKTHLSLCVDLLHDQEVRNRAFNKLTKFHKEYAKNAQACATRLSLGADKLTWLDTLVGNSKSDNCRRAAMKKLQYLKETVTVFQALLDEICHITASGSGNSPPSRELPPSNDIANHEQTESTGKCSISPKLDAVIPV